MLGGPSDSVPTVKMPGVIRRSAAVFTSPIGSVVSVVCLSSASSAAGVVRSSGKVIPLSTPAGAH